MLPEQEGIRGMTETTPREHELPTIGESGAGFSPLNAVRSVGMSLFINGVCPYLLYRFLQPNYPAGSVLPLVYASIFPLVGFLLGLIRTRTADFIALFALFEISWNIATALLASSVHWALILRASEGFIVAAVFLVLTLLGAPPILYISRQFAAGADTARRKRFDAVDAADHGRTFRAASLVWVAGILFQTSLNLTLSLTVKPADYLLFAQIVSITTNVLLVVWTVRFSRKRLERVNSTGAAAETEAVSASAP
jgi:hypothetical protein